MERVVNRRKKVRERILRVLQKQKEIHKIKDIPPHTTLLPIKATYEKNYTELC